MVARNISYFIDKVVKVSRPVLNGLNKKYGSADIISGLTVVNEKSDKVSKEAAEILKSKGIPNSLIVGMEGHQDVSRLRDPKHYYEAI